MKALVLLLTLAGRIFACPPFPDALYLELNKAGVTLKAPPAKEAESLRRAVGARKLEIGKSREKVPQIKLVAPRPKRVVVSVGSQTDLSRFFRHKECLASWDAFHACHLPSESADMKLVRRIDEAFIRPFIGSDRCECNEKDSDLCEKSDAPKGSPEPDFLLWRVRWQAPAIIRIEAPVGESGGFGSPEEAGASLHRINALLKRALYGARFPESRGEGRTPDEIFWTDTRPATSDYDLGKALGTILERLEKDGYLTGFSAKDRKRIVELARGGRLIYYLPPRCAAGAKEQRWVPDGEGGYRRIVETPAPGWRAGDNNARLSIDETGCPRYELLR